MALKNKTCTGIITLTLVLAQVPAYAAGISIGEGASLDLGTAIVDVNCGSLTTAGQLHLASGSLIGLNDVDIASAGSILGDSGTLELAGDWRNAGSFTPSASDVQIQDGCGQSTSSITGDTDFHIFRATTTSGKTLSVQADSLQTFSGGLQLEGVAPNDRLSIRSSVSGQQAHFVLIAPGVQQIAAVDVRDNDASLGQPLAPGVVEQFESVDSGNNLNWFTALLDLIFQDSFETK